MTPGLLLFLLLFHYAGCVRRKFDTSALSPVFSLISDIKLDTPLPSLLPLISSDRRDVETQLKQDADTVQQDHFSSSLPSFQSLAAQLPSFPFSSSLAPVFSELSSSATLHTRTSENPVPPINSLVSVTSQLPSLAQIQQIQAEIQNVDQQRALLQGYLNVAEQAMQSSTMVASMLRDNVTQAVAQVLSNKEKLLNWIEQQKEGVVNQLNEEERHMTQLASQSHSVTRAIEEANQKLLGYHKLQDQLVTERQLQTTSPLNPSVEKAMLPLPQFQQTITQLISFQHAASQVVDQGAEALRQLSLAYQTSARWYISTRATLKAWLDNCQQAVTNELKQAKAIVGQAREQWAQYSAVYNQAKMLHEHYKGILGQLVAKRAALQNEHGSLVTNEVDRADVKRQQLMAQIGDLSVQLQQSDRVLVALRQTAADASAIPPGTVPAVQDPAVPTFVAASSKPDNLPRLAQLLQPDRLPRLDVQQRNGMSFRQQPSLQSQPMIREVSSSSEPNVPQVSSSTPVSQPLVAPIPASFSTDPIQSPINAVMLANLQNTVQPFRAT